MSATTLEFDPVAKNRAINATIAVVALWFGAFLSGFVINEPSPYEFYFVALIPAWALLGLTLPRQIVPLIALLVVFNIGGIISMGTMDTVGGTPLYLAVSFFLALTSIFFAAVIAADEKRLGIIMNAYVVGALISSALGIISYLTGIGPFTLYGRARGAFQDPNVFAPYLILPALWCLYQVLVKPLRNSLPSLVALALLTLGIFLSFSRAGWGFFAMGAIMVTVLTLLTNTSGRFRLRVALLSLSAITLLTLGLLVALQFEAIRDVFLQRAQLVQDYDGARVGRFARHILGYILATERPFGIGPLEFGRMFGEDTHNIWLKALFDYSWLGFAAYILLVFWTLGAGLKIMFRQRPWQGVLICAWVTFFGHMVIGNVIDTDHWRHFYLVLGVIWGCIALEARWNARQVAA